MSSSVLSLFSSKNFTDSAFTFRSLIHFEFIFVYGVRKCSHFILSHFILISYLSSFPSTIYWRAWSLPHCIVLPSLSIEGSSRCVGLFLGFLSCSIGLYFCFCGSTILSWWLYSIIWSQEDWFLQPILPSQDCFGYSGSFVFLYE